MPRTIVTLALDEHIYAGSLRHIPGSHVLNSTEIEDGVSTFDFTEHHNDGELPMSPARARELADENGRLKVVILLDQESFFGYIANSANYGSSSAEDYAHDTAFAVGVPEDCSLRIIGVVGKLFVAEYETFIGSYLDDDVDSPDN